MRNLLMTEQIKEKKIKKEDVIEFFFTKVWAKKKNSNLNLGHHKEGLYLLTNNNKNSYFGRLNIVYFNTLEEVLENRKTVADKNLFKISMESQADKHLFCDIFLIAPLSIQIYMAKKAPSFISNNYSLTRMMLEKCNIKKDAASAKVYLENVPASIDLFDTHDYGAMFGNLFNKEESYQMYLQCIAKRADSINRSYIQNNLKEFLLGHYKYEAEKLESFAQYLPTLKSYLSGSDGNSIFYEKEDNELAFMIDYEKLKGSLELGWDNKQYAVWVNSLLQVIAQKDKRVNKIFSDDIRLNNNQTYKQIFVYVKPNEKIDEKAIKTYISKFICHLTQNIYDTYTGANERKVFITKWWNMNKLADSLTSTDLPVVKRNKI